MAVISGAQGLWTMYENASVMLEMADYAARFSDSVDRELLATLRSDAMQIRVSVLSTLAKYAFSQVNESISANVSNAASMYTEMAARTAELLQANCGNMVPNLRTHDVVGFHPPRKSPGLGRGFLVVQ